MVTHSTTNLPIQGLCMAERTGCPMLLVLWSYVEVGCCEVVYVGHGFLLGVIRFESLAGCSSIVTSIRNFKTQERALKSMGEYWNVEHGFR